VKKLTKVAAPALPSGRVGFAGSSPQRDWTRCAESGGCVVEKVVIDFVNEYGSSASKGRPIWATPGARAVGAQGSIGFQGGKVLPRITKKDHSTPWNVVPGAPSPRKAGPSS